MILKLIGVGEIVCGIVFVVSALSLIIRKGNK
jgi:hypothetical protein